MNFESIMIGLLSKEPFYFHFLMTAKVYIGEDVKTAGVNVTDKLNLYINPSFMDSLPSEEAKMDVLKHEIHHVMGDHFDRYNKLPKDKWKNVRNFNIATDAAINEHLPNLPDKVMIEGELRDLVKVSSLKKRIKDLEHNMHSEYYHTKLTEHAEETGDYETLDDHSKWGEGEQNEEFRKQIIKDALEKSVARTKAAGQHVPECAEEALKKLTEASVNWRGKLRNFIQNAMETRLEPTRKRPNRRYGWLYPGYKKEELLNLCVIIDTSGSMSNKAIEQIYAEIYNIDKQEDAVITIMDSDTEVREIKKYNPKKDVKVSGRGGTYYTPALKKAEEMGFDSIIYFGDGDCFETDIYKPKIPVMWGILKGCKPPVQWGTLVEVDVKE